MSSGRTGTGPGKRTGAGRKCGPCRGTRMTNPYTVIDTMTGDGSNPGRARGATYPVNNRVLSGSFTVVSIRAPGSEYAINAGWRNAGASSQGFFRAESAPAKGIKLPRPVRLRQDGRFRQVRQDRRQSVPSQPAIWSRAGPRIGKRKSSRRDAADNRRAQGCNQA